MNIIFASNNQHKLQEIQHLLGNNGEQLISQQQFNVPEVAETGLTFVENAILKARNACQHTKLPAIADDSGLEVDALNGQPGIYSSRYAGNNANATDNIKKLLTELVHVPFTQRTARFQCIMVYLKHAADPTPLICQGTWEGTIALTPQGEHGFGYDPVFWLKEYNCTVAELPLAIKNTISHRAQALQKLAVQLPLAANPICG